MYTAKVEYNSKEDRNYLTVTHNGQVILEISDGGEPEDNSFIRDWGWVPIQLELAYQLGRQDKVNSL